jgi:hypothetical protein
LQEVGHERENMTIKESFNTRYGNGSLHNRAWDLIEKILVAAAVGLVVMYGTVGKIETKAAERDKAVDKRLERLYERTTEIRNDVGNLRECFNLHLQQSIPTPKR